MTISAEGREEIRKYVMSLAVLPAGVLAVIGFALGWFINEGARGSAYAEAYAKAQSVVLEIATSVSKSAAEVSEAARDAEGAKKDIDSIRAYLDKSVIEIDKILENAKKYQADLELVADARKGFVDEVAQKILASPTDLAVTVSGEFGSRMEKIEKNISEIGDWPEGNYCIIANDGCPVGFTKTEGYMRALSIYPEGELDYYIKQSEPKMGGIIIQCHGECRHSGQWTGEIWVSTCCK